MAFVAPSVSAVVPAKGEELNLPFVLPKLARIVDEVVVVLTADDVTTAPVVAALCPSAVLVRQRHGGKGAALSAGLAAVTGDIVVALDADGSMDPGEIPAFVGVLLAGADLVKGSRFAPGGRSEDLTLLRRAGNVALRTLANRLFRKRWSELAYGYFAMWTDVVPALGLAEIDASGGSRSGYGRGFEIETLTFTRAARAGLVVAEVPSVEYHRIHGVSSLRTFFDGFRVLSAMLRERLSPAPTSRPNRLQRSWQVGAPRASQTAGTGTARPVSEQTARTVNGYLAAPVRPTPFERSA